MAGKWKAGDLVVLKGHPNPMMTVQDYTVPNGVNVSCKYINSVTGKFDKETFQEDSLERWSEEDE